MKKIFVAFVAVLGMILGVSCMHDCSCVVKQEFVSPGNYTLNIDTTVVPSKSDCSLMNIDTVHVLDTYITYDTTYVMGVDSTVVDTLVIPRDTITGRVYNITICQ